MQETSDASMGVLSSAGKKSWGHQGEAAGGMRDAGGHGCRQRGTPPAGSEPVPPRVRTEPGRGEPGGAGAAPACWERGPVGGAAPSRGAAGKRIPPRSAPAAAAMTDNIPLQPVRQKKRMDSKHRSG